jgi:pantetheine-phosphate adenylyltransferase
MSRIAIFPGTFDPFTKGHQDIALRGSMLFDKLIISIGNNSKKNRYFDVQVMLEKIADTFKNEKNISVEAYEGLTAHFAQRKNAQYILRGLRNTTDFEYENSIAQANRQIFPQLETVFLITSPQYAHISSTITREVHKYGQAIESFVPYVL